MEPSEADRPSDAPPTPADDAKDAAGDIEEQVSPSEAGESGDVVSTSAPVAPGEQEPVGGDTTGRRTAADAPVVPIATTMFEEEQQTPPSADQAMPPPKTSSDGTTAKPWFLCSLLAILAVLVVVFAALYSIERGEAVQPLSCPAPPPNETQDLSSLDPAEVGQWESVIPEDNGAAVFDQLGMHSVHAILLPSGKVLLAPGSGWRNDKDKTTVFPETPLQDLKPHYGLYDRAEDPFINSKRSDYYKTVNNVGTYDPASNEFFRVPHPVPEDDDMNDGHFVPTDLFCTGHLHLPNGNALFIGGTQFYLPHFSGHRATYIYDWIFDAEQDWSTFEWTDMPQNQGVGEITEDSDTPWFFSGFMERGRWYPSIVPLMDGKFVIIGGFVDFQDISTTGPGDMYLFEVNELIEFFDYRSFNPADLSAAWKSEDIGSTPDSPFQTELLDEDLTEASDCTRCEPTDDNCLRLCAAHKNDTFKLYPRVALMPDGHRIFFTRDGDYNSMRDPAAIHMRNTKFTYIMDIGTNANDPQVSFTRGPDLPRHTLNAGSVIRDPNNPLRLLVSGGMKNSGGFYAPGFIEAPDDRTNFTNPDFDIKLANHYLGGRGSRGVLTYNMPSDEAGIGSWDDEIESFLGPSANSERTMHYKVILPNRQVLVLGGGNYWFAHTVRNPVLYTPSTETQSGYDVGKLMAPQIGERLYHNTGLLLADGRVFMAGGNPNRASLDTNEDLAAPRTNSTRGQRKFNPRSVERDVYFINDGRIAKGHKPSLAEEWTAEIYSPPYLFIDGARRTVIEELRLMLNPNDIDFFIEVKNKRHYLLQSNLTIQMELSGLPGPDLCPIGEGFLTLVKLASSTHGWDSGQQLFNIPISSTTQDTAVTGSLEFQVPDSDAMQIVPAFYHLFYVDCRGKPTEAASVRLDNNVQSARD